MKKNQNTRTPEELRAELQQCKKERENLRKEWDTILESGNTEADDAWYQAWEENETAIALVTAELEAAECNPAGRTCEDLLAELANRRIVRSMALEEKAAKLRKEGSEPWDNCAYQDVLAEQKGNAAAIEKIEVYLRRAETATGLLLLANRDPVEAELQFCRLGEEISSDLIQLFCDAADQGDAAAQFLAGLAYSQGVLGQYLPEEAARYFRLAAEQGHAGAQYRLGLCYLQHIGVPYDLTEGASWIRKAAAQDNAAAQYILGTFYENGAEEDEDPKVAVAWYRKAADQGYPPAVRCLGLCYEEGTGVEQDLTQAANLYRQAAGSGDTMALYLLGQLCERTKDLMQAVIWYRRAADQGDQAAAERSLVLLNQLVPDLTNSTLTHLS